MLCIKAKHNKTNYAQRPQHRKPFANHWSTCGVPTSHFGNLKTVPFVTIIKSLMTKSIEMLTNLEIWEPQWMLNMRTKTQSQLCLSLVQLDLYGHQLGEYYHLRDTTNDNPHTNKMLCPVFENNIMLKIKIFFSPMRNEKHITGYESLHCLVSVRNARSGLSYL